MSMPDNIKAVQRTIMDEELRVMRKLLHEGKGVLKGEEDDLRPRLFTWILVVSTINLVRCVNYMFIFYRILSLRYKYLEVIVKFQADNEGISESHLVKMMKECLMLSLFLSLLCAVTEVILIAVNLRQNPIHMLFTYSLNLCAIMCLLFLSAFLGSWAHNIEPAGISLFGNYMKYNHKNMATLLARNYHCCGLLSHKEFLRQPVIAYKDIATGRDVSVSNTYFWMEECVAHRISVCHVPLFCCVPGSFCGAGNGTAVHAQHIAAEQFEGFDWTAIHPIGNVTDWMPPCLPLFMNSVTRTMYPIMISGVILAVLTVCMTVLMSTAIAYHASLGRIDKIECVVKDIGDSNFVQLFSTVDHSFGFKEEDEGDE